MSAPHSQADMISTLKDRLDRLAQAVKKDQKFRTASNGRLLGEMANLLDRSEVGEITASEWEDRAGLASLRRTTA